MHGPPPPLPNLDPVDVPRVVRTVDEVLGDDRNDVVRWADHHERELEEARTTIHDFGHALTEAVTERRKIEEEQNEAIRRPPGAGQPGPGLRETRRRSRAQRHR